MIFESDSIVVILLVFFLVAIVPVKLVAGFAGAKNASFLAAFITLLVAIPAFYVGSEFSGLGYLGAYIGMGIAVWLIMRPPLFGALLVPAIALIVMLGVVQALSDLSILGFSG